MKRPQNARQSRASRAPSRLPPPYARLGMLAMVLPACAPEDCPKGSVRNLADGLCYQLDDGEAEGTAGDPPVEDDTGGGGSGDDGGDSGGDDGGDSGGDTGDPTHISDSCEPPADLPTDPLTDLGAFHLQSEAFAEAVDIELDTAGGVAVLVGQGGIMTVNISDPDNPTWIGHHGDDLFRHRFYHLEMFPGGLVYATNWDEGLVVYDVMSGPDPIPNYELEAEGYGGMALHGDVLYMVDMNNGELMVWDVTDPGNPVELTSVGGLSAPLVPILHDGTIYVADNALGIVVYDISDATSPTIAGVVDAHASVQDLSFSADGTTLYAAAGGAGVQVYSLDDPTTPTLVETIPLAYSVISVDTGDDLLWAVNQQDIVAIDITDPRVPVVLNAHRTGQWSMHVAAAGSRAWVADWGYIRGYEASGGAVGSLDPSTDQLYLSPEGDVATVSLMNPGGDDLVISGITVSDERVSWDLDDNTIEPGESATLTFSWDGGGTLEADVCIASNDPVNPTLDIDLVASADGGRAGIGVTAPDFVLDDLDGRTWRLSDLRGRPVVLAYFATW